MKNKNGEKISVIVPVYQIAAYLKRCADSLFNQTHKNMEIILTNDGSSDRSGEILDEFALQNVNVVVCHKKNEGVTTARLTGVQLASGNYIGFCDGDDEVELEMYERLYDNLIQYDADISHCGHKVIYTDGREVYFYNTGRLVKQDRAEGLQDLLTGSFEPGLCSKLFRKNLLHSLLHSGKMDTSIRWFEDLLMNYYLFDKARISVYEDICLYNYIKRTVSASQKTINQSSFWDPVYVRKNIYKDAAEQNVKRLAAATLMELYLHLYNIILRSDSHHWIEGKKQIQNEIKVQQGLIKNVRQKRYRVFLRLIENMPWLYEKIYGYYDARRG